jgi:hypothetical protein
MASQVEADDFARRFAEYWSKPTVEGLKALLRDDVRLAAPGTPTTENLVDGGQIMGGLFELMPDLTGQVHRWGPHGEGLFIEFTLSGTLNGVAVSWRAIDSFELDEHGMAKERVSYFDPAPILAAANNVTE